MMNLIQHKSHLMHHKSQAHNKQHLPQQHQQQQLCRRA